MDIRTVAALMSDAEFAALSPATQARMIRVVAGIEAHDKAIEASRRTVRRGADARRVPFATRPW